MNIISLGAGVQSSTMALMAMKGEITPIPDAAVFADTQAEPKEVYNWLDWLEKKLTFPVYRVTKGNLANDTCTIRTSKKGNVYSKHSIPAFIKSSDGKVGILMRQCTSDHKIAVIHRQYTAIRKKQNVTQWIGISADEISRIKPARKKWITNRYPLIELNMSRNGCFQTR